MTDAITKPAAPKLSDAEWAQDQDDDEGAKALFEAVAHIKALAAERDRLRDFHKAVAKAAGNLEGLPDGHAFNIVWALEGEPDKGHAFITVGMIRRAALAADADGGTNE